MKPLSRLAAFCTPILLSACTANLEEGEFGWEDSGEVVGIESALCSGPANADAFPSAPVPVVAGTCTNYQVFSAAAPTVDSGTCGFVAAFGPMGGLVHPAHGYELRGNWAVPPTNPADCAAARTTVTAWGYGCLGTPCRLLGLAWQYLGTKTTDGFWNAEGGVCYVQAGFSEQNRDFKTVQIQVEASQLIPGGRAGASERRQAAAWIHAYRHNGQCTSATANPGGPAPHSAQR